MLAAQASPGRPVGSEPLIIAGVAAGAVLVVLWGMSIGYTDVDVWGAFVVPVALTAITLPFLSRSRWLREEGLVGLASFALIAKFIGSYLRYLVAYFVYNGNDSGRYHSAGVAIAEEYLDGRRGLMSLWPSATGTQYIEELNGVVALLSGRSILASFMVFSWLSFFGLLGFVAAGRRAVPGVRLRGYAMAVFFLPSMVFWPSALGKDAWMVFGMGLIAVGIARLLTGSVVGSVWLLVGGYATAMVRPHVTALMVAGLAFGYFGRHTGTGRRPAYVASFLVIAVLTALASAQAAALLPGFDGGIGAVLEETQQRSAQGGSEIGIVAPNSPVEYPFALLTVLFRPFLFEVSSITEGLSALEGTALLAAFIVQGRRVAFAARGAIQTAYLRFAGLFVLGFGFAWASVGNLGIIVRQRVQVLPLLLLILFVTERTTRSGLQPARQSNVTVG